MDKLVLKNKCNDDVYYLKWYVENPKCCVVISHGMGEHPYRYDELAKYLNEHNITVYAPFHIGHGQVCKKLAHMDKNDFDQCVTNLSEIVDLAKNENNCNVYLLGHSMGSFLSQIYISRYNNINGLILSGSSKATLMHKAGSILASIIFNLSKNKDKPSKFLSALAFGSYNNKIKDNKTAFDWLNRDDIEVQKYIDDEYCGWVGTTGFFYNLTTGIAKMGKKKYIKNINRNLPILILGGTADPVSRYAKDLIRLKKQYEKINIVNVNLILYKEARHEIYKETNKNQVFDDTLKFIESA